MAGSSGLPTACLWMSGIEKLVTFVRNVNDTEIGKNQILPFPGVGLTTFDI